MATVNLGANAREAKGSRTANRLRRTGKIPAILYGHGMKPLSLEVDGKELHRVLHTKAGENVIISLKVQGENLKESTCLIKAIQHNPITDEIQHLDLTVISLTEKIEVKVPLVVKNTEEAVGVKEGGVLDVVHHEIEIECLPTQIPEKFEVDVKKMKIGDYIHIKDLVIPQGIVCKLDQDEVVIALHAQKKEEEVVAEETPTQPEVIEKGKKVEEEVEGQPAAPSKASEAGKKEQK